MSDLNHMSYVEDNLFYIKKFVLDLIPKILLFIFFKIFIIFLTPLVQTVDVNTRSIQDLKTRIGSFEICS